MVPVKFNITSQNTTNVTSAVEIHPYTSELIRWFIVTGALGLASLVLLVINYGLARYYTRPKYTRIRPRRKARNRARTGGDVYRVYFKPSQEEVETPTGRRFHYPTLYLQKYIEKRPHSVMGFP